MGDNTGKWTASLRRKTLVRMLLRPHQRLGVLLLISSLLVVAMLVQFDQVTLSSQSNIAQASSPLAQSDQTPLCQFSVNVKEDIDRDQAEYLRIGWYLDYAASSSPTRPNGSEYMPVISLTQIVSDDYRYSPSGSQLQEAIDANPGADWLIGNEPDRRYWQDDLEPHVYASAYHELYHLIKSADPTAGIVAGNIVQPTPIRLMYLDLVLSNYHDMYGVPMPVDIWGVHNFILNEVSCYYNPLNCWGAEIPPGIDLPYGEILAYEDNDSLPLFMERIERFRQWMADRGYGGLPLYVTEYGILMPQDFGFPPSRVNAYMNDTFDYMLTATDPALGNPNDDHRLVQRFSWYSTTDDEFNGWLFDPDSGEPTIFGINFSTYTAQISETVNLYPLRVFAQPAVPLSQGENVTFTLKSLVANSGNVSSTQSILVRFYEGDPSAGGVQIGIDQTLSPLSGCGDNGVVQVEWADVAPGGHTVYVVVDPLDAIVESVELDNVTSQVILVATHQTFLPAVHRGP